MTTISELVQGDSLEKTIISSCSSYRKAFTKIIEKSGVGDNSIDNKLALTAIIKTRSWNWAAFAFSVYWAIYRKQKIGWYGLILILGFVFLPANETLDKFLGGISIWVCIGFGIFGNSMFLRSVLRVNSETSSPENRQLRSFLGLGIAILISVVALILAVELFGV